MRRSYLIASMLAVAVLASACTVGTTTSNKAVSKPTPVPTVAPSPSPLEETEEVDCPDSWTIAEADNGQGRWFADGIRAIRRADTKKEARSAAEVWLARVKLDPQLLSGAAVYFLDKQVSPSKLRNEDCASEKAVVLVEAMKIALADARVKPAVAPANGRNSGTNPRGEVAASSVSGVSGDRKAVRVVLKDGTTVWIMARCGNPVTVGPPPHGLPLKQPRLSTTHLPVSEGGHGAGGVEGSRKENNNATVETGCNQDGCNGDKTEPKAPKDPPPPEPETNDPEEDNNDDHTGKPPEPQ